MDRDQLRSLLEQVLPAVWRVRLYLTYALAGVALGAIRCRVRWRLLVADDVEDLPSEPDPADEG